MEVGDLQYFFSISTFLNIEAFTHIYKLKLSEFKVVLTSLVMIFRFTMCRKPGGSCVHNRFII